MHGSIAEPEGEAQLIRNWLLTILRFAVTREDVDRMCVQEMARVMDGQNRASTKHSFCYFLRTSAAICNAVLADLGPDRQALLHHYLGHVADRRLRAALEAACECHRVASIPPRPPRRNREDLWRGLRQS